MLCVSFSCEMEKCIMSFFLFRKIHYAFRRKFRIWSISFFAIMRKFGFCLGSNENVGCINLFFKILSLRFVTVGHKETFPCFPVNRSKLTRTNWLKECSWESIALALLISWLCWQHCKRISQASAIDSQPPFDLLAVHFSLSSGFLGLCHLFSLRDRVFSQHKHQLDFCFVILCPVDFILAGVCVCDKKLYHFLESFIF